MVGAVHARCWPGGAYLASLPADRRAGLREQCRPLLPEGPFEVSATADTPGRLATVFRM